MSAFVLFDVKEVIDPDKLNEYRTKISGMVEKYGGQYRVIGGQQHSLEGDPQLGFPVIIEFENVGKARRWYDSKEYEPLKNLRLSATKGSAVLIDGDVRK